jgi:glycosyltransferase involved in cell wall biosynthesis
MSETYLADTRFFDISVSVIVPVYNSFATLTLLVQRLQVVLQRSVRDYEICLVNDGSQDDSWQHIVALACQFPKVRGLDLMRNYGQHNALLAGIRTAQYEVIVTLDDDLQNPPEEIPSLLEVLINDGLDVVYGSPLEIQQGLFRNVASEITKIVLSQSMGSKVARRVSAFRAFRTKLRDAFADYAGPFVNIDVLLTWGTSRFSAVFVEHSPRQHGRSQYSFKKLVTHAFNMITGFSVLPLQFATIVGLLTALFGVFVLFYVLASYLVRGNPIQGFPFLASIISIFAGSQLLALGIIGEYLARMYFRLMDRPPYTISSSTIKRNE